jgi:hypothetical protein
MNNTTTLNRAFTELSKFVQKTTRSSFDTNTIRERLKSVKGLKKTQLSSVVNRAINQGLIERIGTTNSNKPNHNGGKVGVYVRRFYF